MDLLASFHSGDWSRILSKLRDISDMEPEIAAARAICETVALLPPEPEPTDPTDFQVVDDCLVTAAGVQWPDLTVCKGWTGLLHEISENPKRLPSGLRTLVENSQDAVWYPIWALAPRALAYFDQRGLLHDWFNHTRDQLMDAPAGKQLAWIEAGLECAKLEAADMLPAVNADDYAPLLPEITHLWKVWLQAEFACWNGGNFHDYLDDANTIIVGTTMPQKHDLCAHQWNRLVQRITLLNWRSSIHQPIQTDAIVPDTWDSLYIRGCLAWSAGNPTAAHDYFTASQQNNYFQSRVAFEAAVLSMQPISAPDVPDMRAMIGLMALRDGQAQEAEKQVNRLDDAADPFSLRLIWPEGYRQRVARGRELAAYLAEARNDWPEALAKWDQLRTSRPRNPTFRAHRLYLISRLLQEQQSWSEESELFSIWDSFQRDLGQLSVRTLSGDALFYRGLAAAHDMPELAVQDWKTLAQDKEWIAKQAPERLVALGDRLRVAGLIDVGGAVYAQIPGPYAALSILAGSSRGDIGGALEALSGSSDWWNMAHVIFLWGKGNKRAAQKINDTLPDNLAALGNAMISGTDLRDALENLWLDLPPVWKIAFCGLSPQSVDLLTLDDLRTATGVNCDWIFGQRIRSLCARGDLDTAAEWINEGQQSGITWIDAWAHVVQLAQRLAWARSGQFDAARGK